MNVQRRPGIGIRRCVADLVAARGACGSLSAELEHCRIDLNWPAGAMIWNIDPGGIDVKHLPVGVEELGLDSKRGLLRRPQERRRAPLAPVKH